jgi:hypothetical protein
MNDDMMLQEQFVISYELLHLLAWLLKYQEAELSQIIVQACIKGYEEKLKQQTVYDQIQNSEDVQHIMVKFFNFLEHNIANISTMEQDKKLVNQDLIKTLDQIDPECFDYDTIKSTVLATADKITPHGDDDAKNLFLKELLRQWDPTKQNQALVVEN